MCRIYGYFGNKKMSVDTLHNVAKKQIMGGPDAQSLHTEQNWAIGANRLAIQGLDGGLQPFYNNKIYAVFNGEIYNYLELKQMLEKKGYVFNDNCDGSVIIPLYEIYGENFVKYLDGMFALAIFDKRYETKKLFLGNDPSSIKSIYYYFDQASDTLFFSSELTSLLEFPIPRQLRLEALDEYLVGRAIWHGKTFFKEIYELNPSTILIKTLGQSPKLFTYESLVTENYNHKLTFEDTAIHFNSILENEIQRMVKADVPVCLVTSGGLDSSYMTALATKHKINLECFNISYEGDWPTDEKSYAKEVAEHTNVKYNQVLIKEKEFPEILNKTIQHLGQPNSAPHALSTYALFNAINSAGFKAAITGEGADEYFGGYERFRKATFDQDASWLNPYFDKMCATTEAMKNNIYSDSYKNFLKDNNHQILENAKVKILKQTKDFNSRLKSLLLFDQIERFPHYILRRVDHLSMANSVEVRVPFCQPKVINFARSLPDNFLVDEKLVKKIIYQAAQDKLPESVLKRPKQPFTLPIVAMLKKDHILFNILYETLNSNTFHSRGIFNKGQTNLMIQKQLTHADQNTADLLWSIMILELWLRQMNLNLSL